MRLEREDMVSGGVYNQVHHTMIITFELKTWSDSTCQVHSIEVVLRRKNHVSLKRGNTIPGPALYLFHVHHTCTMHFYPSLKTHLI